MILPRKTLCALLMTLCFMLGAIQAPVVEAEQDYGWSRADQVEVGDGWATDSRVVLDEYGYGTAILRQHDGTTYSLYATHHSPGEGWMKPFLIEASSELVSGGNMDLETSPFGTVAVWRQNDVGVYSIWSSAYSYGDGWGTPVLLEADNSGFASRPDLALDHQGNGMVVWEQSDGTRENIWGCEYDSDFGWGAPFLIETDDTDGAHYAHVEYDGEGNAIVAWSQNDGANNHINARRHEPGTGWGSITTLESHSSGDAYSPELAVDIDGNAVVAWTLVDGIETDYYYNTYDPISGWGSETLLVDGTGGGIMDLTVVGNKAGDTFMIWNQLVDGFWGILVKPYSPDEGWGDTETIGGIYQNTDYPSMTINEHGHAVAIWSVYTGFRKAIRTAHFDGQSWSMPNLVDPNGFGDAEEAVVAMDGDQNAIAMWTNYDGDVYNIWGASYKPYDFIDPEVNITSPVNGTVASNSTVTVTGMTEPGVHLVVNGVVADVADNGSFTVLVSLNDGENLITAMATDGMRNTGTDDVTVVYVDPLVGEMADTQDDLNDTKDAMTLLNDTLMATLAELGLTQGDLSSTTTDLDTANSKLDATEAGLEQTQEDLDAAEAELDDLRSTMIMGLMGVLVIAIAVAVLVPMLLNKKEKEPKRFEPDNGMKPPEQPPEGN